MFNTLHRSVPFGLGKPRIHMQPPSQREMRPRKVLGVSSEIINNLLNYKYENRQQSLWETLNDNNLLPLEQISEVSDKALRLNTIAVAIAILNFSTITQTANAQPFSKSDGREIEWALEAIQKIDPIEILSFNSVKRGKAPVDYEFTESDKNVMAWNIYHEARGEKQIVGKLGVLLSVFERLSSGKFGDEPKNIVFSLGQYSWVKEKLNEVDGKVDVASYTFLRRMVAELCKQPFRQAHKILKQIILEEIQKTNPEISELPENLTHYHKKGMLEGKDKERYISAASYNTINRIKIIEELYKRGDKNIIVLGSHIYYPDSYTSSEFIIKQKVKLGIF